MLLNFQINTDKVCKYITEQNIGYRDVLFIKYLNDTRGYCKEGVEILFDCHLSLETTSLSTFSSYIDNLVINEETFAYVATPIIFERKFNLPRKKTELVGEDFWKVARLSSYSFSNSVRGSWNIWDEAFYFYHELEKLSKCSYDDVYSMRKVDFENYILEYQKIFGDNEIEKIKELVNKAHRY